jgi:hypothetical protein
MGVGVVQPSFLSLFWRMIGGFLLFRLKINNVKSLGIDILFISLGKFLNQLIQNDMKTSNTHLQIANVRIANAKRMARITKKFTLNK